MFNPNDVTYVMNRIRSFMFNNGFKPDPADVESLEQSIEQKLAQGWLPDEVFAHIKNNEAVNPDISEKAALANMAYVRDGVMRRLDGEGVPLRKIEVHGKATLTEVGPTIAGQLRALACIEALQELVRLKDIKERMEDLQARPLFMHGSKEEFKRLREEYEGSKNAAWQAAWRALEE